MSTKIISGLAMALTGMLAVIWIFYKLAGNAAAVFGALLVILIVAGLDLVFSK